MYAFFITDNSIWQQQYWPSTELSDNEGIVVGQEGVLFIVVLILLYLNLI